MWVMQQSCQVCFLLISRKLLMYDIYPVTIRNIFSWFFYSYLCTLKVLLLLNELFEDKFWVELEKHTFFAWLGFGSCELCTVLLYGLFTYAASRYIFLCRYKHFDNFSFKKGGRINKSGKEYSYLTVQQKSLWRHRYSETVF